ncbi:carboxypeptidase-like regulatory domain-containing protein [[Clostridium] innocuum]|nr:carboxypeptidase-like regulatory domain-containing protein [[Clostridium] innocuum]
MVETMEESAQPIPNAQISVFRRDERGSVFIKEYRTNESGRTQRIELDAPDSSHSTDIHSLTRPYGQYDIHVAKEGYDTEVRNGVQIFAETDSTLTVVMQNSGVRGAVNSLDIGEHQLHEGGGCRSC